MSIDALKELYGEDAIISIAIHPGDLDVFTGVDDNHPYNFTTPNSDVIANDMATTFVSRNASREDSPCSHICTH